MNQALYKWITLALLLPGGVAGYRLYRARDSAPEIAFTVHRRLSKDRPVAKLPDRNSSPRCDAADALVELEAAIGRLNSSSTEAEYARITDRLLEIEYGSLPDVLRRIPDRGQRQEFFRRVAMRYAEIDSLGTAIWIRDTDVGVDSSEAFRGLALLWAATDPRAAAGFALTLAEGPSRREMLNASCATWLQSDFKAVMRWADQLGDHADLDSVASLIAHSPACVRTDFVQCMGWAQTIANESIRRQAVSAVLQVWALRDPNAASWYVNNSPDLSSSDRDSLSEDLAL